MCNNVNCEDDNLRQQLSEYCHDLIQACIKTGDECFPKVERKKAQIPYWNEVVQPLKDNALFWSSIWISCGKPREGEVAQIMRCTKHRYQYAIRAIKKKESDLHKSKMAKCLINNRNHRDIWKENKKMNGSSREMPPHMDGTTEPEGIAQHLSDKYGTLYNSVQSDMDELNSNKQKINHALCRYNGCEHIISVEEMKKELFQSYMEKSQMVIDNYGQTTLFMPLMS